MFVSMARTMGFCTLRRAKADSYYSDKLHYTQVPIFPLPFPSFTDLLEGTENVSTKDRDEILASMLKAESTIMEFTRGLSNKVGSLMESVFGGVIRLDSFLGLHIDLFAHCVG